MRSGKENEVDQTRMKVMKVNRTELVRKKKESREVIGGTTRGASNVCMNADRTLKSCKWREGERSGQGHKEGARRITRHRLEGPDPIRGIDVRPQTKE